MDNSEFHLEKFEFKGDKFIITHAQDMLPTIKRNHELRKETKRSFAKDCKRGITPVASIPHILWIEWERLGITQDSNLLLKMCEKYNDIVKVTDKKFA